LGGVRSFSDEQRSVLGRDTVDRQRALVGHTVQKAVPHLTLSPTATKRHCARLDYPPSLHPPVFIHQASLLQVAYQAWDTG